MKRVVLIETHVIVAGVMFCITVLIFSNQIEDLKIKKELLRKMIFP
jgi:hypothetical protein